MIGAYYSKAADSKELFNKLNISNAATYEKHLNKYNVINISFNVISENGNTYDDYIKMIRDTIKKDIVEKYPFIVELKKDELPKVAIKQIREKEYVEKFSREDDGKKILAVAICYDSKSKEHRCKIQEV
ncbi:MAG: hypothetical protein Q8936_20545 [Bacillota bacterium]|nr:hypothetical protein [Bacillota bacterium]